MERRKRCPVSWPLCRHRRVELIDQLPHDQYGMPHITVTQTPLTTAEDYRPRDP